MICVLFSIAAIAIATLIHYGFDFTVADDIVFALGIAVCTVVPSCYVEYMRWRIDELEESSFASLKDRRNLGAIAKNWRSYEQQLIFERRTEMRLIDADKFDVFAYDDRGFEFDTPSEAYAQGVEYVLEKIDEAPTVDAQEVKHGRWIEASNKSQVGKKCSICGARIKYSEHFNGNHLYCHKCGARMDGKR